MTTTWQEFLLEHAKFPFPNTIITGSVGSTDLTGLDIGLLPEEWKAKYAMPDETLVERLCQTLSEILGDTLIEGPEEYLSDFGDRLKYRARGGRIWRNQPWSQIENEQKAVELLGKGFFPAAESCLAGLKEENQFEYELERLAESHSSVHFVVRLNEEPVVLVEAESPLVMLKLDGSLPTNTIRLKWRTNEPPAPKLFQKVAAYLGLRRMEWLFLTSHNSWLICRLVRDNKTPFLAFSSIFSMENSSQPFRAFLGAILSVHNKLPVPSSAFVESISEEDDEQGNNNNNSLRSRAPVTCSQTAAGDQLAVTGLMISTSSPLSRVSFQVWVHLHLLPDNNFALPLYPETGNKMQRLWLTDVIGSGATGTVWQCRSDNSGELYAIKVVESRRRSDEERHQRFRNEFEVYLTLETAYKSKQLCDRITPHCYGAFQGDGISVLVLELCDATLKSWDELNISEQIQVYRLIYNLHSVGINHADLEPRNIVRIPGHQFRLVDFSESTRHTCIEFQGTTRAKHHWCPELQAMREVLKPLQTRSKAMSSHFTPINTTL